MDKQEILDRINKYQVGLSAMNSLATPCMEIGKRVLIAMGNTEDYVARAYRSWLTSDIEILTIGTDDNIEFEVIISWEIYSCGDTDYYSVKFPVRYLWEEGFEEEVRKKEEDRQEKIRRMETDRAEREALDRLNKRRKLYEELKAEFEE